MWAWSSSALLWWGEPIGKMIQRPPAAPHGGGAPQGERHVCLGRGDRLPYRESFGQPGGDRRGECAAGSVEFSLHALALAPNEFPPIIQEVDDPLAWKMSPLDQDALRAHSM